MKVTNLLLVFLTCVLVCTSGVYAEDPVDRTDAGGIVTASSRIHDGESWEMAFDNDINTKWLTSSTPDGWIQFQFLDGNKYAIGEYTITSANDFPARSPKDWTLQGSNDGDNWDILDTREGIIWIDIFTLKRFRFGNLTPYEYYKLDVTANGGESLMGFCEMELFDGSPFVDGYSPPDGSVNIPLDEPLNWEPQNIFDPVFEVYFSTSPSFSDVTEPYTTTETTYNPPKEIYTKYYWKVDMLDGETVYEGDVLSFTTDGKADTPDPADGAIQIGQNASLNWRAVNIPDVTYSVYFGEPNAIPFFVGNVSTNSFTPPTVMDPNKVYYWQVDTVCDISTTIEGDLYSFTTGGIAINPDPPVPDSNSVFAGVDLILSWTGDREGDTYVEGYDLYFGDSFPPPFIQTVTGTSWDIPYELLDDTDYYWQVDAKHDGAVIVPGQPWYFHTGKLLAHWPLESDCTDLIAGQNGVVFESGGSGSHKDPTFEIGPKGNAVYIDSNFYKIEDSPYWDSTYNSLTIATWLKWANSNNSNEYCGFVTKGDPRMSGTGWALQNEWIRYWPSLELGGNFQSPVFTKLYLDDENWHHVVFCWDGKKRFAYADGQRAPVDIIFRGTGYESYESIGRVNPNAAPLAIGGMIDILGNWVSSFQGHMDEVRIYNRTLNLQEVQALYTDSKMPTNPDPYDWAYMVPWDTQLQWNPGADDIVSQTLYFTDELDDNGKMVDPLVVEDLSPLTGSYDITADFGKLDIMGTYYWRIDTITSSKKAFEGPVWSFIVRDFKTDLDEDLIAETDDLNIMAEKWLNDSSSPLPEFMVVMDQEVWGRDPNILDYFESWGPPTWCYSTMTVNTNPIPDPNLPYDPGSQTVQWWFDKTDGGPDNLPVTGTDAGFVWYFAPEDQHVDFNLYDKLIIWMKLLPDSTESGSFYFWILYQNGVPGGPIYGWPTGEPYVLTWNISSMPTKWTPYEVYLPTDVQLIDVVGMNWGSAGGNSGYATIEFDRFELAEGSTVGHVTCWEYEPEDFNRDCDVNIHDFVMLAEDWLRDAN
jgi:hypothetical protein